jgi:hypothetical protein
VNEASPRSWHCGQCRTGTSRQNLTQFICGHPYANHETWRTAATLLSAINLAGHLAARAIVEKMQFAPPAPGVAIGTCKECDCATYRRERKKGAAKTSPGDLPLNNAAQIDRKSRSASIREPELQFVYYLLGWLASGRISSPITSGPIFARNRLISA